MPTEHAFSAAEEPYAREPNLDPSSRLVINEARARNIEVEILAPRAEYFRLRHGGRAITCRESLSELTSAVALSRCDDKRVTQQLLRKAGLSVPAHIDASTAEKNRAFLEQYGTIVVKPAKGEEVRVTLTDKVGVFGVVRATLKDVTPGAFIGVGATPQADGTQKAIRVMIFAEVQRGTGEGHRPWNRPGTTMTNATVDSTVAGVDGQVLRVTYKGGEQRIVIGPDSIIMASDTAWKLDLVTSDHG